MSRFVTSFLLLCTLALAGAHVALAQERDVRGTVVDATTGDPLPGVNIVVQGTDFGTATNLEGDYSLTVPGPEAVLVFSFVGYIPYEARVGEQAVINVSLQEDVALIDEIIVVGYGTQRRGDVTSSIATIDIDDANVSQATNVDELLEGRVAGVQVIENNGEPGAGISVRIRGGTSISASNEPLYVIDGVPIDNGDITPGGVDAGGGTAAPGRNPLNLLNPSDIESISILKDASATAIYGSRGANGVVLITTKNGVQGRVSLDYEGRTSVASASNRLDLISGDRYRQFIQDQVNARNLGYVLDEDGNPTDVLIDNDGNGQADVLDNLGADLDGDNEPELFNSDFQDAVLRTGISQQHNLSFSGGTSNTQYRASLSYLNQEGIIISSGLERVTARLNADNQSFDGRLRLGLNLTSAISEDDFVAYENTAGFEGGLFTNVYDFDPTKPIETAEGAFYEIPSQFSIRNPVALARQIDDAAETTRTLGNVSAELDLIEGLTAQVNLGGDRSVSRRAIYLPLANPIGAEVEGQAAQRDLQRSSVTLQTLLTYRNAIRETHAFDVLGGYEFNEFYNESFGVEARRFVTDALGANNIGSGGTLVPGNAFDQNGTFSFKESNRLISFFSRANYNFRERYYLSGSLRYDGSSRFGIDNKWALFPAISGAWRISNESFMEGNDLVSDLRVRAGYGVVGNQSISNLLSLALLEPNPDSRAVLGGQIITGFSPRQLPNEDLKWEEKKEFTVGLDYGFFDGRAFGSLEFYRNQTDNLLLEVTLPQPAPVEFRVDNLGSLRNTGIDFSLDAFVIEQPETTLQLGVVFNTNSNEIIDLGGQEQILTGTVSGRGQSDTNSLLLTPGQPFPVFYGIEFAGYDEDNEQLFNIYDGDELVGTTTESEEATRRIIGDPRSDFSYGFRTKLNWKNLGFSMFFRGEQGRELFNNTALVFQTKSAAAQGRGFLADALDDPDALREAPVFSSRWIEDASFLKLDNVTLEYTLQPDMLGPAGAYVRNARVYLSVDNVFTITPYSGYDPEVNTNAQVGLIPATGIDYTNYPLARTFTVGVNLGF